MMTQARYDFGGDVAAELADSLLWKYASRRYHLLLLLPQRPRTVLRRTSSTA